MRPYHVPPPYDTIAVGAPVADHPLGTIGILSPSSSIATTDLHGGIASLPLMVPIVCDIPANGPEPLPPPVDFRERQLALVPAGNSLSPADIVAAVNARPRLSPERMGAWLAARLENPILVDIVCEAVTTSSHPVPEGLSRRNLQRIVPKVLRCRVSDLVRLYRLATLPRCHATVDALAEEAGTATTHLRDQVRGLGVSLRDYNQRPGWEWPLEAAVRRGLGAGGWGLGAGGWGLGEDSEVTPMPAHEPTFLLTRSSYPRGFHSGNGVLENVPGRAQHAAPLQRHGAVDGARSFPVHPVRA